jgi:hypothetical protein
MNEERKLDFEYSNKQLNWLNHETDKSFGFFENDNFNEKNVKLKNGNLTDKKRNNDNAINCVTEKFARQTIIQPNESKSSIECKYF